jgi:ABC-2 type transport system ATP-binding protein
LNQPALRVNGISRRFGTIKALDDVSFTVEPQSIFGLLGPNGAGKTTLFSIAAGFIRADAGDIEVLGIDVRQIARLQGRLSILPQDALFQRNVPIVDQLVFFRLLDGRTRSEAEKEVHRTLEMVGLGEYADRRVHALSHGMVNRLGVAQAFLGEPEVILLDEPTSGLDPANARQIRDIIMELKSRATVLISSHNLAEIEGLCDDVAILDRGKLAMTGSMIDITRWDRKFELRLSRSLGEEEKARLESTVGIKNIGETDRGGISLALDLSGVGAGEDTDRAIEAILKSTLQTLLDMDLVPRDLREGATLEDRFLAVTGGANSETVDTGTVGKKSAGI